MTVRDLIRELLEYSMEAEVLVEHTTQSIFQKTPPKCTGVEGSDEDLIVTIRSRRLNKMDDPE